MVYLLSSRSAGTAVTERAAAKPIESREQASTGGELAYPKDRGIFRSCPKKGRKARWLKQLQLLYGPRGGLVPPVFYVYGIFG